MKTSIILTDQERQELLKVKRGSKSSIVKDRAHVVLLKAKGKKVKDIADVVFRGQTFVKQGIKRYIEGGIEKVKEHQKGGNSRKLTEGQKEELKELLEKEPKKYGFKQNFWSIELLEEFVEKRYKIRYKSKQSYYHLFKYCGYSFQRPGKRDIRQDPVKVEEFKNGVKKTYESTKIRLSW